jgi:DivIVA domain-containing protein
VARPGGNTASVNGDQVRDTWFCPPVRPDLSIARGRGYRAGQVDELLRRVAAELDSARPAGSVIENATLGTQEWGRRYDIDAVDWFLGQFLLPLGHFGLAATSSDPWHDLPVAQLASSVVSDPAAGMPITCFTSQCENAWRDFGQQPGTHLWWGRAGRLRELRTAEQQPVASVRGSLFQTARTVSVGGRNFTCEPRSVDGNPEPFCEYVE